MTMLHPQLDNKVEQSVKTVVEHLLKAITSRLRDWDVKLPVFLFANRAFIHENICFIIVTWVSEGNHAYLMAC
jgi:hypothetical protein